jgi:hypothetical protein
MRWSCEGSIWLVESIGAWKMSQFNVVRGDLTHAINTTPYPIRIKVIQITKNSNPVGNRMEIILTAPLFISTPSFANSAAIASDISRSCLKAVRQPCRKRYPEEDVQYRSHFQRPSDPTIPVPGEVKPTTFSSPNSSAPSVIS